MQLLTGCTLSHRRSIFGHHNTAQIARGIVSGVRTEAWMSRGPHYVTQHVPHGMLCWLQLYCFFLCHSASARKTFTVVYAKAFCDCLPEKHTLFSCEMQKIKQAADRLMTPLHKLDLRNKPSDPNPDNEYRLPHQSGAVWRSRTRFITPPKVFA